MNESQEVNFAVIDKYKYMIMIGELFNFFKSDLLSKIKNNFINLSKPRVSEINEDLQIYEDIIIKFTPKKELSTVNEYLLTLNKNKTIMSFGISYGEISEYVFLNITSVQHDLPLHAKIGLRAHFQNIYIEELNHLEDAIFYLEIQNILCPN